MVKRSFKYIVTCIKQGEEWANDTTKIYLNNEGVLVIEGISYLNNTCVNTLGNKVYLDINNIFWLNNK